MATRYTDNQTGTYGVVETFGQDRDEENDGVWKARWTNIREGERERGKKHETAKESIRSTTESVRWTPINNDARDFTEEEKEEGRGEG